MNFVSKNCTLLCVFYSALTLSGHVAATCNNTEPITYNMDYSDSAGFGVAWSGKYAYKDYTHIYPVVTFTKYATTIDDFIENYPKFTIQTSGYAYSDETFGDVGANQFGPKTYLTSDFKNTGFFERFLVKVDANTFWWTGAMNIGFGFKYDGNKLYLRPFLDGWLYSGGAVWRYLHYGMSAPSITFHPETCFSVSSVLSLIN